jgi:hypothetical protein
MATVGPGMDVRGDEFALMRGAGVSLIAGMAKGSFDTVVG